MRKVRSSFKEKCSAWPTFMQENSGDMVNLDRISWQNRAHFFAIAARAMPTILVDYAVKRKAQKRGGDRQRVPLEDVELMSETRADDLLALDGGLEALDARWGQVVEYRFFGGLSIKETAEVLGISEATVARDWTQARAWLNRELKDSNWGVLSDSSA